MVALAKKKLEQKSKGLGYRSVRRLVGQLVGWSVGPGLVEEEEEEEEGTERSLVRQVRQCMLVHRRRRVETGARRTRKTTMPTSASSAPSTPALTRRVFYCHDLSARGDAHFGVLACLQL